MKQVLIKKGNAIVEEVPPPSAQEGFLLIKTRYSCISVGTEMSSIVNTSKSPFRRALENPDQAKQAVKIITEQGISKTKQIVKDKLNAGNAVGYSAAGIVLEVGAGVDNIKAGDRVACAGAGYAYHAEIIIVPKNLVTKIPDAIGFADASTVTLGAIALQGVRRADPSQGEIFVVFGLGILGQLAVQLLINNGCSVVGVDINLNRCELAKKSGAELTINANDRSLIEKVNAYTDSYGADGVIITAASSSNDLVSQSFQMCRKKGRVVLVGDVGLNLQRSDFYSKEIDFLISTSYGPGRYDSQYEVAGYDYPFGYVRWTENRNMQHYLNLLASNKLKLDLLVSKIFPVEDASDAYNLLKSNDKKPLLVLLSYNVGDEIIVKREVQIDPSIRRINADSINKVSIAIIGAGGFAKAVHLPNIKSLSGLFQLRWIVNRSGYSANMIAKQYHAEYSSTSYSDVLSDSQTHAVLIATRHNMHSKLALEFLKAGKHVFVEKPLSVNQEELNNLQNYYETSDTTNKSVLMTGFNRRFSIFLKTAADLVKDRISSMMMNYHMNAGYIPLDHWVHSAEGGGRNIGEACHIYDVFTYLTNARVNNISVSSIVSDTKYYSPNDNFCVTINFEDGSIGNLLYTALGSTKYPKEMMEIFVDGKTIKLANYKTIKFYGIPKKPISTWTIQKGHKNELEAFGNCILHQGKWPIPLWQQIQATEIALKVEQLISDSINKRKNIT